MWAITLAFLKIILNVGSGGPYVYKASSLPTRLWPRSLHLWLPRDPDLPSSEAAQQNTSPQYITICDFLMARTYFLFGQAHSRSSDCLLPTHTIESGLWGELWCNLLCWPLSIIIFLCSKPTRNREKDSPLPDNLFSPGSRLCSLTVIEARSTMESYT